MKEVHNKFASDTKCLLCFRHDRNHVQFDIINLNSNANWFMECNEGRCCPVLVILSSRLQKK